MRSTLQRILTLVLCLALLCPFAVQAENDRYVTQTAMVRALATMLQSVAAPDTDYTAKSEYGGATGNFGFAQTFFYRLFLTELGESDDLTQSPALTTISVFAAGDRAQAATLSTAIGALRFGDLVQYGKSGHISFVLGETAGMLVLYDCGFGEEENNTVRLRLAALPELEAQALREGNEGGLYFFRSKNLPTSSITLNLVSKPTTLSYYLNADPTTDGLLLEYYSEQTGKVQVRPDSTELKIFASTKTAGEVPMVFLYGSALAFCTLEVKNETVDSLKIDTMPTKLEYTTEEEVDMTGAVVTAKMLDGTTLTLTPAEYTLSYAFTSAGSAVVTLAYGGKTTSFSVTVKEPPVTKLSVLPPTKTEYYVGERLDLTGGSVVVDYTLQTNVTLPLEDYMISAYDTSLPGEISITVNYGGKTTSFPIRVVENQIASLRLSTGLNKQYRKGASLNLSAIELVVLYEDGQTRTVSAEDCKVFINGKESSTFEHAGDAEVVFTYRDVSTGTVALTVKEDPMSQFVSVALIIVGLLIGVPLLVLLVLLLVRRLREKKAAADPLSAREEPAEEYAAFEEEDEDVRIFRTDEGVPSARPADDQPTIHLPKLNPDSPDEMGKTRKLDFFDEL